TVEPQLGGALRGGPVDASDGDAVAAGVPGDPHQVAVPGVEAELVGAQYLLDVLAVARLQDAEADVEVRVRRVRPLRGDQQPLRRPYPVRLGTVAVVGNEHDVALVAGPATAVDAVRGGDQQVLAGTRHHARRAVVPAAGIVLEQRADPQRARGGVRARGLARQRDDPLPAVQR